MSKSIFILGEEFSNLPGVDVEIFPACNQLTIDFTKATTDSALGVFVLAARESLKLSEIECNSGGRFIAVPASGATIRGYSATQILVDECAYIPNDEETIVALLPMLGDGPNCRIVYASTPAGKNNFFARLFLNARPGDGIHRIVVSGESIPRLATRVARLKQQLSPTRYRQEVCVEMLSDGLGYFDLDLIGRATSDVKALQL